MMVRALKGLEDVISCTIVHPTWQRTRPDDPDDQHFGWVFGVVDGSDLTNKEIKNDKNTYIQYDS